MRGERIEMPVSASEKANIVAAAQTKGMTVAAWLRMVAMAAAKGESNGT